MHQHNPFHLPGPDLEWRGHLPVSRDFDDPYFSRDDGLAESRHVFLDGNDLARRWRALPADAPGLFTLGETGFGSGLNLLAAWQLWREVAPPGWRLQLISTELYPLDATQLRQAVAAWPELAGLAAALLHHYPPSVPGPHWLPLEPGRVDLLLLFGDAATQLAAQLPAPHPELGAARPRVDAWFLDGFAPARNPGMWTPQLFQALAAWSRPGSTFATFTAAGEVRRGLAAVGFAVDKRPGHGRKRDMLAGHYREDAPTATPVAAQPADYWACPPCVSFSPDRQRPQPSQPATPVAPERRALVVGAGLAGSACAAALARRGWRVTLVDAAAAPAQHASGNARGVLYTRLSHRDDTLSRFALASYLFARGHYRALLDQRLLPATAAGLEGMLQLAHDTRGQQQLQRLAPLLAAQHGLAEVLDAAAASARAGLPLQQGGLWFPDSGWLDPRAVCRAQAATPGVTALYGQAVQALRRETDPAGGERWRVVLSSGAEHPAEVVVLCAALDSPALAPAGSQLPLRPIRGQVSALPATIAPGCVICHEGYVVPEGDILWVGATFDPGDGTAGLRAEDHRRNLDSLARALPALAALTTQVPDPASLEGRAGVRAASPDYLPLAGALPRQPDFDTAYAALADNARRAVATPPPLWPGLFTLCGLGSRGLTYAPVCAELIAAQASGEPPPLPRDLVAALSPARFAARERVRGQRGGTP